MNSESPGADLVLSRTLDISFARRGSTSARASKVVVASVTEGEDKPLKYPLMYPVCDLLLLNKMDNAAAVAFDCALFLRNCHSVNPGLRVIEVSARSGEGIHEWLRWLDTNVSR